MKKLMEWEIADWEVLTGVVWNQLCVTLKKSPKNQIPNHSSYMSHYLSHIHLMDVKIHGIPLLTEVSVNIEDLVL